MTRTTSSRLYAAGLLFLAIIIISSFLSRHSSSSAQINKPTTAATPKVENLNFLIAAPYWSVENGFVSTIELKNYHVEEPLTITPTGRTTFSG